MNTRPRADIRLSSDQKRLVWHLKTQGPTARSVIAAHLDMHNASVTRLARELIMLGCIEEQESLIGRGRPMVPLTISGRAGYAAGAMVHPGWLEIVLVDFAGVVLARHREAFDSDDPRVFIELVETRLRELALANQVMRSRFLGLGVAVTGPVVEPNSPRRWTVNWLKGWRDVDHPEFFQQVLGLPVWVENDATLAGLAEFYDGGLLQRYTSAISLFIGHGVGGGVISRRDILQGEFGNSGDVGRLFPRVEEPRPSGIDLLREINAAGGALESLLELDRCLDSHAGVIAAWVDRASDQLLSLAASGAAWIDPGVIIISGSLPPPILDAIGERMRAAEWIFGQTTMPRPEFYVSKIGGWAASVGAAMLPIHDIIRIHR